MVLWSKLQDFALLAFRVSYKEPPVTRTCIQPSGQTARGPVGTALRGHCEVFLHSSLAREQRLSAATAPRPLWKHSSLCSLPGLRLHPFKSEDRSDRERHQRLGELAVWPQGLASNTRLC